VSLRALVKNKTYAFINIVGLAIGMAACLLILLFVRHERSFDTWIPGHENVYQLQSWYKARDTGLENRLRMTPYVAGKRVAQDFPQVEREVYAFSTSPVMIQNGEAVTLEDFVYTDGSFLRVVPLPMLQGDQSALDQAGTAVIAREEAIRRFGTDNVVGRTLSVISRGVTRDFRINGVLADIPSNSHMQANVIARIDFAAFNADSPQALSCWGCQNGWVYLKLRPGADPDAVRAGFQAWERRNIPDENAGEARYNAGDDQDWHLVNIADVHLGEAQDGAMRPGNDSSTIVTFAVIALLILAMAVVNFTNLATARASQRAREVALRKVLGASRKQLIVQFLAESVLISILAMTIALALAELLLPWFAAFLEADMEIGYFGADGIGIAVLLLVGFVGVLGGLYPAFFISRFQPATVLKANKSSAEAPGTGRLRTALVVGQFAVSIGLIICTAVIYAQTAYARSVDPGYNRSHILQVDELSRYQLLGRTDAIVEQTRRVPGVQAVGRTTIGVATDNRNNSGVMVPGQSEPINIGQYQVDDGFFDAMGLRLVAGRWFDRTRPADDMSLPFPATAESQRALAARGANVVITELAAERLGFRDVGQAVGKTLRAGLVENEFGLVPVTIVGVVRDARFRSMREPLDPIMFQNTRTGQHSHMIVRFQGDPAAVRAGVEGVWKQVASDVPFNADFSEDVITELYRAEDARAKTFAAFAILAVVVACLGLFGLAAFTAERRTKEIGIRKVLGARTRDIVRLLAWQFSKPVLVANLIAWPVAYLVMWDWLDTFDARVDLGPAPFILAGGAALAIAIGTIAGHAIKVARANPIHALRYE
jgi:putative ABC transport system permease protein